MKFIDQHFDAILAAIVPIIVLFISQSFSKRHLKITLEQNKDQFQATLQDSIIQRRAIAYAELLASIEEITEAKPKRTNHQKDRYFDAARKMNKALATLDVLAPIEIATQAEEVEDIAFLNRDEPARNLYLDTLTNRMRKDIKVEGEFELGRNRQKRRRTRF